MADAAGRIVIATPPFGATLLAWSAVGLTRVRLLVEGDALPETEGSFQAPHGVPDGSRLTRSASGISPSDGLAQSLTRQDPGSAQRVAPARPGHRLELLARPAFVDDAIDALRLYFSGTLATLADIPLDHDGQSDFHRAIYAALRRVPYGETTTYGDLARAAGFDAGASRAVGVAMGRNPWPVIVPCHRVMASGGKMGGFSAPGGTDTKARLLRLEGAQHAAAAPMLPGLE